MDEGRARILVVDDEAMNRDVLGRRLKRRGFEVVYACDGRECLDIVAEQAIDLVLLDVMMPGLSGFEVLAQLRETLSPTELPVLMCTAKSGSEDVVQALEVGANDYITKPIDFKVALARIRSHLESRDAAIEASTQAKRLSLAVEASGEAVWDWDLQAGKVFFSKRWCGLLGEEPDALAETLDAWLERAHPADRPDLEAALRAPGSGADANLEHECRLRHADGRYRWMVTRGMAVRGEDGRAVRLTGTMVDVTSERIVDTLTGLPNRRGFLDALELPPAGRTGSEGGGYAVFLTSIDQFSMIYSGLGREKGDELLLRVADVLRQSVRRTDSVGRLENDVFALMLTEVIEPEAALAIAKRLRKRLSLTVDLHGGSVDLAASVGVVHVAGVEREATSVLTEASEALRGAMASDSGIQVFDSERHQRALARLKLEADIRRAILDREFVPFYQPIVCMKTGRLAGFEALVRWRHPRRGMVSPGEFIPVAEATPLINEIGSQMLRDACRQMRLWQDKYPTEVPRFVTVNVSGRQLTEAFLEEVRRVLHSTALPPMSLKLEVTESAVMADPDGAVALLESLRRLGLQIAIDDFGTGHSSLAYVHRLPANTLKVDQSFVREMTRSDESRALVKTIVMLAGGFGMDTVAEGIETSEDARILLEMGCEYGQGWLFSKAVDAEAAGALLAEDRTWPQLQEVA